MISKIRSAVIRGVAKMTTKAKNLWSRIWSRGFAAATARWTLTIGSAALTVYVLDYFLPVWLTAAIASTLIVHEFGHYITALRMRRKADPPIFIPFIWGVWGGTRVPGRGSEPTIDGQIALAGPTWGFIWALGGAGFSLYFGQQTMMWAFLWLSAFNLWHGTLGSDGKFYQTMRPKFTPEVKEPVYAGAHLAT